MKKSVKRKIFQLVQSGQLMKLKHFVDTNNKKLPDFHLDFVSGDMNRTPLHIACLLGDDAVVRCLLNYGADATIVDKDGETPLHLAAKFVGEDGNYTNHKLLIDPLLKYFPDTIDTKNNYGEIPRELLHDAKRKHKLMLETEPLSYEEEFGKKFFTNQSRFVTHALTDSLSWNEKLANSLDEDCADAGIGSSYFEDEEWIKNMPDYPTFDAWADRVAAEYRRKQMTKSEELLRKKNDIKRQKVSDCVNAKDRLEREREKFRRKIAQKKADQLKSRHDSYQEKMSKHISNKNGEKKLRFKHIPWPCLGTIDEMVEVIMSGYDDAIEDSNAKRKYVRKQQILWHPDKFIQRCHGRLDKNDEKSILDTVKMLSQSLNEILKTL